MLLQYLRTAFGTMRREKANTLVAVLGLTLGLTAFAFIVSYCLYFHGFDRQVTDYRQWYRVRLIKCDPQGVTSQSAEMIANAMPPMVSEIPQIKDVAIFYANSASYRNLLCDGHSIDLRNVMEITPNVLTHDRIKLLYSQPDSVFATDKCLIISRTKAKELFGNENPIGKEIWLRNWVQYRVTGVFEDLPPNLHLRTDALCCWTFGEVPQANPHIGYATAHVRVRIPNPKDLPAVEQSFNRLLKQYPHFGTYDYSHYTCTVKLDPITKIHFMSGLEYDQPTVNPKNIIMVGGIGILILLAALLNFINLLALGWRKRTDEFSSRRAIGASRADLFRQLAVEYGVQFLLALLLSVALYAVFIGTFAQLVGLDLAVNSLWHWPYGLWAVVGSILLGLLSGSLAALRCSRISVMSEEQRYRTKQTGNLTILFVQLAIGTVFVLSALALALQMRFIEHKNLGYQPAHLVEYNYLSFSLAPKLCSPQQVVDTLQQIPGVKSASASDFSIVSETMTDNSPFQFIRMSVRDRPSEPFQIRMASYYPSFFKTCGIHVLQGEVPQSEHMAQVVVNHAFCQRYLDPVHPLGSALLIPYQDHPDSSTTITVAGIVEDTNFLPLHYAVPPVVFFPNTMLATKFQVDYMPDREISARAAVDAAFARMSRENGLRSTPTLVAQKIKSFYHDDNVYAHLTIAFAWLIVLIALMGNYAVTSLYLRRQMKDIAIRKVCGAEFRDIFRVYVRGYLYLFGGAVILGGVVGEMMIRLFLARFSIQAPYLWAIYPLGLIILAIIVFVPFGLSLRKAYRVDPTVYLQSE